MKTITLNRKPVSVSPLTYGQVKANAAAFNQIVADGLDNMSRTAAAEAFLLAAGFSQEDIDATSPGELMVGALEIYGATFTRPEAVAPATTETASV